MQLVLKYTSFGMKNENQNYRICANIYCSFADSIFRKENIRDKEGKIRKETLSIYLNSSK